MSRRTEKTLAAISTPSYLFAVVSFGFRSRPALQYLDLYPIIHARSAFQFKSKCETIVNGLVDQCYNYLVNLIYNSTQTICFKTRILVAQNPRRFPKN